MSTVQIDLPDDVLALLDVGEARAIAREALLVKLCAMGKLSTGRAAEILGVSRRGFLNGLSAYGVSEFDDDMNPATEAQPG